MFVLILIQNITFLGKYLTNSYSTIYKNQKQPPEVFCKKDVLRNFAKFTGIHCVRVSFLIKLQALRIKKISSVFLLCGIKSHWWNIFHFLEMEANICACIYVYIHISVSLYIYIKIFFFLYIYIYIYKAKLKNELTPSWKTTQFSSYYIIFLLSSKLSDCVLDHRIIIN